MNNEASRLHRPSTSIVTVHAQTTHIGSTRTAFIDCHLQLVIMDFIEPILSVASEIYALVEKVKANRKRCRRVSDRVKALEELVLSGALQVEQGNMLYKVFELTSREKEDEVDGREDDTELKELLLEHMKIQQEKMDAMLREFESVKTSVIKVVKMLNKPSVTDEVIRMIKPDEVKYEHPKEPFMKTQTSEVYRGQYHGFTVAVKRYRDQVNASAREIRSIFNKEVETMRRFESPNILRMFGICVQDEDGPNPQFLIIMEYCEKGSLRQVLDSNSKLSWIEKARMCLDAAQGLYRLHQTEVKSKVHGCINSSKFLVAEGYRVKLGGFELAKTETSLKKSTKNKGTRNLCYSSPQMLNDINHVYSKECEMYSFGIVVWEVATRKRPFEGCSGKEIYKKVSEEKFQEPLPDDCPEALGHLINTCRAYDSFQRPSAGVLVDKLRTVVTHWSSWTSEPILSYCCSPEIYTLVEKGKPIGSACCRVSDRVKALEELMRSIRERQMVQASDELEKSLKELFITLKSAQQLIKQYTLANWVEKAHPEPSSHGDEFKSVNQLQRCLPGAV
ncbi:mixed lineage kinase domain-like protein [Lates japonicus]|uniref:Mixed lineage kinase domain-like protein n=1 Tax=Lates japonicus TaxID=270547 RepID=A0AAD3RAH3_LATJO|nr:mixed lineage kinase domain-like protein [Lates japonicus]